MKVLVIGAQGMLGQAIMNVFSVHDVVGIDRPNINITRPADIRRALDLYKPHLIINCAAFTAVDDCETKEPEADLVNGTAVGYLARAAEVEKIPIVHISTDYVFSGDKQSGYTEDAAAEIPVNAYGRTKLHGEQQLLRFTKRFYLVRTSWLYGPGGKNFVQTMLDLAKTKSELKVVNDQHGKPTYTVDLANFILELVDSKAPYGIYHGVNEQGTNWYVFASEIFRQAGLQVKVSPCASDEFPRPAKRPSWSILLNTKRPPLRPWPEALRDYLSLLGYSV